MAMDLELPRGLWSIGKATCFISIEDGRVHTVEVNIKRKLYIRLAVARLVSPPSIADPELTNNG